MWIFQFNESGKIIWTDAQSALALGYQDAHQLLDLAADLFIHISRFSRWTEEMMTIDPLQGAVSHQFLTAGEFLIEGDIPEINYSSQAGAKGINCVPIFHVLRCELSGYPIINWPGMYSNRNGEFFRLKFHCGFRQTNPKRFLLVYAIRPTPRPGQIKWPRPS